MTLSLFDYEFQTRISLFVLYNKINIRTDVILFLAGGRGGKEASLKKEWNLFMLRVGKYSLGGKDIDSEFREASDMFLEMRKA